MTEATTAALRCAACGSPHLVWRVKRDSRSGGRLSERTLVWSCRECGSDQPGETAHSPVPAQHEGIAGAVVDLRGV